MKQDGKWGQVVKGKLGEGGQRFGNKERQCGSKCQVALLKGRLRAAGAKGREGTTKCSEPGSGGLLKKQKLCRE